MCSHLSSRLAVEELLGLASWPGCQGGSLAGDAGNGFFVHGPDKIALTLCWLQQSLGS